MEEKNVNNKKIGFKKYKRLAKRIIIIGGISSVLIGGLVGGVIYKTIKGNINYNQEDLKKVALETVANIEKVNGNTGKETDLDKVKGEVIRTNKEIDDDTMSIIYEFKIKGKDNMLYEVEVDSNTGAVIDFEGPGSSIY